MGNLLAVVGLCALFGAAGAGANAQRHDDHGTNDSRMHGDDHGMRDSRMHGDDRGEGGGFRSRLSTTSTRKLRRELMVLKRVYDHEIKSGHTAGAMRAHMRANAIRAQLHERRTEHGF